MSIKIEVTANSIDELADKLLALGTKLNGERVTLGGASFTIPAVEDKPVKPKREAKKVEEAPLVANAAEPPTASDAAEKASDVPSPAVEAAKPLDFDTDVAPVVIKLVTTKGKPAVSAILEQFGAARASEVDPASWPELLALLKAAM